MEKKVTELDDINSQLNKINGSSKEKFDSAEKFKKSDESVSHSKHSSHHHKRSKKKMILRILLIILCVILALCLILATTWFILYKNGQAGVMPKQDVTINISGKDVTSEDDGRTIYYNGQKYTFNNDVTSVLCLGIDKTQGLGTDNNVIGTGGQADAIYLIAMNYKTSKYTAICISRDTVADIGVYSAGGQYIGTEKGQLCLSYAYGDGKETSCVNTTQAVSRLFYNVPINTYFAIDREAISVLNDEIGGVTVPVYDENGKDTGEKTTLHGSDAEDYVHYRDIKKLDSNNLRIKRQLAYLKGFSSQVISATKNDLGVPLSIYNTANEYAATNLDAGKITYFTTQIFSGGKDVNMDFVKMDGKVQKGKGGFAEYIVNEEELLKLVISVYYEKVDEPTTTK